MDLLDLSQVDFEALKAHFQKGRKRTEAEKLKRAVGAKLNSMFTQAMKTEPLRNDLPKLEICLEYLSMTISSSERVESITALRNRSPKT